VARDFPSQLVASGGDFCQGLFAAAFGLDRGYVVRNAGSDRDTGSIFSIESFVGAAAYSPYLGCVQVGGRMVMRLLCRYLDVA